MGLFPCVIGAVRLIRCLYRTYLPSSPAYCTVCGRSNELDLHTHLENLTKLCSFAINERRLTPTHEELFLNEVLPRATRALLNRVYIYEDFEVPLVVQFLHVVMKVIIVTLAEVDTPLCVGSLDSMFRLFDDNRQFYSYDLPLHERQRLTAASTSAEDGGSDEVFALPLPSASPLLVDNVNYFGRLGGFDAVVTRLAAFQQDWETDAHDVSLTELYSLLLPVMSVFDLLAAPVKRRLADTVRKKTVANCAGRAG